METYGAHVEQASLKQVGTSKLAIAAGLVSICCLGLGGVFGLVLGLLALGQIRASKGDLGGEGLAWLGVVLGALQIAVVGWGISWVRGQTNQAPEVARTFMAGVARAEPDAARGAMTAGLRPLFERGRAEKLAQDLREVLGEYQGLGAQRALKSRWEDGLEVEAEFELLFDKGAPAQVTLTMVREYESLRVRSFEVRSPVLRVPVKLEGRASQELGEFTGGKAAKPKVKSFGK
jgi:hypothetical protein